MKEYPIIFNTDNVRAILDGRKTQTRRVVTKHTSVIGEGGDWAKLCWDGSAIYQFPEIFGYKPIKKHEKAPLPYVDDGFWERDHSSPMYLHVPYNWQEDMTVYRVYCHYDVGDRLWVRETWATENRYNHLKPSEIPITAMIYYLASIDYDPFGMGIKRPSIFMPRWASRITLEITGIRVERLQEITTKDINAEGITALGLVPVKTAMLITGTNNLDDLQIELGRAEFASLWDSLNAKRGYGSEVNPWVWVISFKKL